MANRSREEGSSERGENFSDSSADWGFPGRPGWWAAGLYLLLTLCATYPLVLNPSQSVYSPGDHISTDIYSAMAINLWWPKHAIWELGSAVTKNGLLCAPYGQSLMLPSLIGIAMFPITLLAGPVLVSNLLTWAGYFFSAFFHIPACVSHHRSETGEHRGWGDLCLLPLHAAQRIHDLRYDTDSVDPSLYTLPIEV